MNLPPAPWEADHYHVEDDEPRTVVTAGANFVAHCDDLDTAAFIALARNAFDIWYKKDPEAATLWLNDTEKWYNEQARRGDVNA